jgi:tetratricopeptide (TPR) repeat protein
VLSAYLQRHPDDPKALAEAGSAWLSAGKPDRAAAAMERALAAGDRTPGLRRKLGLAYMAMRKPGPAEQQLKAALAEKPADMEAALALSQVYAAGQRWLEVVLLTQAQARAAPKDPRPWWPMADAYAMLADVASTASALAQAVRLSPPKDQRTAALRALALAFGRNLPEVAVKLTGMNVLPRDPDVLAWEGQALESAGRWAEAARMYEEAAAGRPEMMAAAARCWTAAGDKTRALACLVRVAPTDPAGLRDAVELAMAMKRPDLAERYLRRIVAAKPGDVELHLALTELLAEYGETWQALLQAEEARGVAGADALRIMGGLYERGGQTEAAVEAYVGAWRRAHKLGDAEDAARLMRRLGLWDRMAKLVAETPKLTPRLRVAVAWLAVNEKQPERALRVVVAVPGPESAEVRAAAQAAKGDLAAAVDAVAEAWDSCPDRDGLCSVLRQAAGDARARDKALNLLPRVTADPSPSKAEWAAVDALLTAEYGGARRLKALAALAAAPGASMATIRRAAEELVAAGGPAGAISLADRTAQAETDRDVKAQLLALAGRLSLGAEKIAQAADYLLRAAALRNEPIVLGRLAVVKKGGQASTELRAALDGLAAAWADDAPDSAALLAFLATMGDEGQLQAWVKSDRGSPADRALREGQAALMIGKPDLAVAQLSKAPPGPVTRRTQIVALIKAGRPSEAEAAAEALLRHGPTPGDLALVGDVAMAMQEMDNAAWWYARAVAQGAGPAAAAKLELAATKAGMDRKALDALTATAGQASRKR